MLAAHPSRWFLLVALFLAVQVGPWWYTSPDSSCYLSIARSFGGDDGPRNLGNRFLFYPPGYPLLLAPTFALGERPFVAIGMVQWSAALLLTAGLYRWARPLGATAAMFTVLVSCCHSAFAIYYRRPLSEIAFMTTMVWCALVLDRVRTSTAAGTRWVAAIGGTLLLAAACQIRPNGILLAPGFAAALAVQARRDGRGMRQALLVGGGVGLVTAAVFLTGRALDDARAAVDRGVTYWDYLTKIQPTGGTLFDRAVEGLRIQMLEFLRLVVPGMLKTHVRAEGWTNANTLLSIVVSLPVVVGWRRLAVVRGDVLAWTAPFFVGLNVLWSADQGGRYTLPMLPVIAASLWLLGEKLRLPLRRLALPIVAVHATLALGYWLSIDLPRTRAANAHWPTIDALAERIDRDRDRVAVRNFGNDEVNLLRLTLDRQVYDWDLDASAGRVEIRWLLSSLETALPPGFEPVAKIGPFRLARRS